MDDLDVDGTIEDLRSIARDRIDDPLATKLTRFLDRMDGSGKLPRTWQAPEVLAETSITCTFQSTNGGIHCGVWKRQPLEVVIIAGGELRLKLIIPSQTMWIDIAPDDARRLLRFIEQQAPKAIEETPGDRLRR